MKKTIKTPRRRTDGNWLHSWVAEFNKLLKDKEWAQAKLNEKGELMMLSGVGLPFVSIIDLVWRRWTARERS